MCSDELLRRLASGFPAILDDFYEEMRRHPAAARVITGGERQIERLKESLKLWLHDALQAQYDAAFVVKRCQIGRMYVEMGLDQIYVNAAIARIRDRLQLS